MILHTAWRNDAPLAARPLATEQAAAALHARAQTQRAALCRDAPSSGIRPRWVPLRLLAGPARPSGVAVISEEPAS